VTVRVALVDHGAGNLVSLRWALERAGAEVVMARNPSGLDAAQAIVMPGVGAAAPAMARLRRSGLDRSVRDAVERGTWYLGVCLGLQLLFEGSDEDDAELLGLLGGRVRPIPRAPRLPHIGWNRVEPRTGHPLAEALGPGEAAYFAHTYVAEPTDPGVIVAETEHGGRFASLVARDRLLGTQFHPERSGPAGQRLLDAFVALAAA
jgi:glutamine amidotransferase